MNLLARFAPWLLLLAPTTAHAMWASMPIRHVVIASDKIVVATLKNVHQYRQNSDDIAEGDLVVDRVIWGNAKVGGTLRLRWKNQMDIVCPRIENEHYADKRQLWMLTKAADGSFQANHPDRVLPADEVATVLDTLAAYPYQVIAPDRNEGEPVTVTIIFRNATTRPLAVPAVRVAGGRVRHGDGFALKIKSRYTVLMAADGTPTFPSQTEGLPELPVVHDGALSPVVLAPGRTRRVAIPIPGKLTPGLYAFDLHVNGHRIEHKFRIRTSWQGHLERVRGTPAEIPFYVQTIREKRPEWSGAIMMLQHRRMEAVAVAPELMLLCDSLDTRVRCELMRIMMWMDIDPETRMDFYLARVDDPRPEVAQAAFGGACQVLQSRNTQYRRDEVISRLIANLYHEDPNVRRGAAGTLTNLAGIEALLDLEQMLSVETDPEVHKSVTLMVKALYNPDAGRNRVPCGLPLP